MSKVCSKNMYTKGIYVYLFKVYGIIIFDYIKGGRKAGFEEIL